MDRLQRQDLQARQSRPFATQFDMSEQVSLPFAMLRALLRNSLYWAAASLMTPLLAPGQSIQHTDL
jgi:hypothetical protein